MQISPGDRINQFILVSTFSCHVSSNISRSCPPQTETGKYCHQSDQELTSLPTHSHISQQTLLCVLLYCTFQRIILKKLTLARLTDRQTQAQPHRYTGTVLYCIASSWQQQARRHTSIVGQQTYCTWSWQAIADRQTDRPAHSQLKQLPRIGQAGRLTQVSVASSWQCWASRQSGLDIGIQLVSGNGRLWQTLRPGLSSQWLANRQT